MSSDSKTVRGLPARPASESATSVAGTPDASPSILAHAEARGADRERARIAAWLMEEATKPPALPPVAMDVVYTILMNTVARHVAEARYLEALATAPMLPRVSE